MRRSPIERMRARWVTGPLGHGAAFGLDLGLVAQYWVRWRWSLLRGRGDDPQV